MKRSLPSIILSVGIKPTLKKKLHHSLTREHVTLVILHESLVRYDGVVAGVVDGHVEQGVIVLVPGLELPGSDYC